MFLPGRTVLGARSTPIRDVQRHCAGGEPLRFPDFQVIRPSPHATSPQQVLTQGHFDRQSQLAK